MSSDAREALQHRIATYRRSGDASVLLEDRALVEVVVLRASQGWPTSGPLPPGTDLRNGLDAAVTAGVFLWLRSQVLPQADRIDSLLEATELLTAVRDVAPRAVPRPVARTLTSMTGPAGKSDHAAVHDEAVNFLSSELARSGDLPTVDYAIVLLSAAIRSAASDRQPYYLSDLGTAWLDRFRITGRGRDLESCLDAHVRALGEPVPVPEDQAGLLANYSGALLAMFEHDGGNEILGHALVAARMATDLARAAGQPRAGTDAELAGRYATAPAATDPEKADPAKADPETAELVAAVPEVTGAPASAAVGAAPGSAPGPAGGEHPGSISPGGSAIADGAVADRAVADRAVADRAVPGQASAARPGSGRYDPARSGPLLAVPALSPERGTAIRLAQLASLSRLRAALLARYERDDREVDLDEAVQVAREAVSLAPSGDPARLRSEAGLAHLLRLQAARRIRRGAGDPVPGVPGPAGPSGPEAAPAVLPWPRSPTDG